MMFGWGWLKLDPTVAAGVDGPPRVHHLERIYRRHSGEAEAR
jgi:hypothetical protein